MYKQQIIAEVDTVTQELARVRRDLAHMPTPDQVAVHSGPTTGVAGRFANALALATRAASLTAAEVQAELESLDGAMRLAMDKLAGSDSQAELDALALINVIDAQDGGAATNNGASQDRAAGNSAGGTR